MKLGTHTFGTATQADEVVGGGSLEYLLSQLPACFREIWKRLTAIPQQMLKHGYPAYTRSSVWLGHSEQQFKVKVAADLQNDICRSIERITKPAEFKPSWIKEPAFPDEDMYVQMRHATISKALALLGICVASREHVVIFKQLLQAKALSYLQIDIQHLTIFDYIPVSESLQSRLVIQITPVAIAYGDSFFFLKMLLHGSHSMHLSCYPISPPICGLHRVVRSVGSTSSR
uniref:Uncharacterized protein n=1 Tax=Bubo bubo TaxID=30461 RepID=A0A8C0IBF0_BUBBB